MSEPMAGGPEPAQTVEEAQEQLRHTRDELGRTVDALAGKVDIKSRARDKLQDVVQQVNEKTPDSGRQAIDRVKVEFRTRPILPAVAMALFAGIIIGRLTRRQ